MYDKIESLKNSQIQHGKLNDRVYLMKLSDKDYPLIIKYLDELVKAHKYTKVFAKVSQKHLKDFLKDDYDIEAEIPGFYKGVQTAYFLGKYYSDTRKTDPDIDQIKTIIEQATSKKKTETLIIPEEYEITITTPDEANEMVALYKQVFQTYPFPILEPAYIIETMQTHIDYYAVKHEGKMVALASTEKDHDGRNAEMTDFATLPAYRGKGLATYLLYYMEQKAVESKIKTAYTIARALSTGMNMTFAKLGYAFAGTLINNTNICSRFESMNIWYKSLIKE